MGTVTLRVPVRMRSGIVEMVQFQYLHSNAIGNGTLVVQIYIYIFMRNVISTRYGIDKVAASVPACLWHL